MNSVLCSKNEIIDYVWKEYTKEGVELSGEYFNFDVRCPKKDILEAYGELQDRCNGDVITQVLSDGTEIPYGDERFASDKEYEEIYEGNCEEFLRDLGEKCLFTRYMDKEEESEEELDFVF